MSELYKVLVTGATGFVGSNLVRRLLDEGYEVHILTREYSNKCRIRDILTNLNEHSVNLLDESRLKPLLEQINPDVIFHLATLGIYGGIQSPEKYVIKTNLFGTMNLINACEPINVYGISKCAATLYGNFITRTKGKPIIGFRLFSPFGPYDDKRRVMCITGDGSFQQNIQELQTVVHYGLPLKISILNNGGYLSIRFTQEKYFDKRFIGESSISGVSFPDSEKIANAYGIKFFRVSENRDLDDVLEQVLDYDGPVICEIMNPRDQLIIPTVASEKLNDGTMVSKPLEDMYPFLDREEFENEMIVKPVW